MKIECILIGVVTISLTACSTTTVPLQASVNTIEVKIENSKKGRYYKLLSTSNENTIDSKLTDSDGLINFDISKSKKEIGKCFFVYDGEKVIPIEGKIYKFSNPAFNGYLSTKSQLENERSTLAEEQRRLNNNYSNRNGECVLLTTSDIPSQPSNACSPQEEGTFSSQQCQNISTKKSTSDTVGNSIISGLIGMVAGAIAGPLGGLAAGIGSDLYLNNRDQENKYNECLENSLSNCKYYYNNWVSAVHDIEHNPEKLRQECIQSQQNISASTERMNNLSTQFNYYAQTKFLISESNYCY